MSTVNVSLLELTEALVRAQGITEGNWMLAFEFQFGALNAGPTPAEVLPAAMVAVKHAMLVRVDEVPRPDFPYIVDAAALAAKGKARPKAKS